LLCEWNDLDGALARLQRGLDALPWWGKADDFCLAYITLARVQLACGNRTEAAGALERAARLVQTCGVFSEARNAVEAAQARSWLDQGDWQAVNRWAAALDKRLSSTDPFQYEDELAHIMQARAFMAQDRPAEAIRLATGLEESARSWGRQGRLIEIMVLKALALQAAGDTSPAVPVLTECLELAEPEGYVRVFLDEGRPMQMLLGKALAHMGAGPLRDYAIRLLSHFDAEARVLMGAQERASPAADPSASSGQALVEPLSRRELEVLQQIALGRTNQEIARELIVAPGTVKAHTASIYRKLDVANRTEAVARARQLGILP
jgi:LuxR family maltose regulon positive regulatory protein